MKLIELYDGTLIECQMIMDLLENAGIKSALKDEIIGSRGGGWRPGGSVKVIISDSDYNNAMSIINEFENNKKSTNR